MLTVRQAADELGVTRSQIHNRLTRKTLRGKLVAGIWFIYRDRLFHATFKRGRPRKVGV